jgi:hypothetical protein
MSNKELVNKTICTEWMKYSWDNISGKKLSDLFLPGSHDTSSMFYDFWTKTNVTDLNKLPINFLNIITFGALKKNISWWGLTTPYNVYDQLSNGIRYLDLRITMSVSNRCISCTPTIKWSPFTKPGLLYSHHTFATIPLDTFLNDVALFVKKYPHEKIYIYSKIDTQDDPQTIFDATADLIKTIIGPYCLSGTAGNPTLASMHEVGASIRFVLESASDYLDLTKYDFIQSNNEFANIWCGTPEDLSIEDAITYKLNYLSNNYKSAITNIENKPYIQLSYTITPSNSMVKQSLIGRYLKIPRVYTTLQTVAEQMQDKSTVKNFLSELSVPCIITFDFPFEESIHDVINLNFPVNKISFMI